MLRSDANNSFTVARQSRVNRLVVGTTRSNVMQTQSLHLGQSEVISGGSTGRFVLGAPNSFQVGQEPHESLATVLRKRSPQLATVIEVNGTADFGIGGTDILTGDITFFGSGSADTVTGTVRTTGRVEFRGLDVSRLTIMGASEVALISCTSTTGLVSITLSGAAGSKAVLVAAQLQYAGTLVSGTANLEMDGCITTRVGGSGPSLLVQGGGFVSLTGCTFHVEDPSEYVLEVEVSTSPGTVKLLQNTTNSNFLFKGQANTSVQTADNAMPEGGRICTNGGETQLLSAAHTLVGPGSGTVEESAFYSLPTGPAAAVWSELQFPTLWRVFSGVLPSRDAFQLFVQDLREPLADELFVEILRLTTLVPQPPPPTPAPVKSFDATWYNNGALAHVHTGELGVGIAGGSFRAASATVGMAQAWYHAGLLTKAKIHYLTTCSGSNLPLVMLMYIKLAAHPAGELPVSTLLGQVYDPATATISALEEPMPTQNGLSTDVLSTATEPVTLLKLAQVIFSGPLDRMWGRAIAEVTFRPFGWTDAIEPSWFSSSKAEADSLIALSPDLGTVPCYVLRDGMPELIHSVSICNPHSTDLKLYPMEITPVDTGFFYPDLTPADGYTLGGRVSTYAFDADTIASTGPAVGNVQPVSGTSSELFRLQDAMELATSVPFAGILRYWFLPNAFIKETRVSTNTGNNAAETVTDGSPCDSFGLLSMLKREVAHAVVMSDFVLDDPSEPHLEKYFYPTTDTLLPYQDLQVFQESDYQFVLSALRASQKGDVWQGDEYHPAHAATKLRCIGNVALGIPAYDVIVLWVVSTPSKAFTDTLLTSVRAKLWWEVPDFPLSPKFMTPPGSWKSGSFLTYTPFVARCMAMYWNYTTTKYVNPFINIPPVSGAATPAVVPYATA